MDTQPVGARHAMTSVPVVIAGGGPVGMALAIMLGQRGIRCTVVERHETPQPIPRGQNLTQRTMEHFHFWRAEAELRAARTIPPSYGSGGMTAYGTLFGRYRYDWLQRELVRPFYHTDNERLPQYETEAVLRHRAAALPSVKVLYGWTVESATQTGQLTIAHRDGADRRELEAEYVVGCEGSRSRVREGAGITQTRQDHDRVMVLLVFRSEELHRLLEERCPGKSFFNVLHPAFEGYWQFFGRVDLERRFFFHAPVPPGTTRDNTDFAAMLRAAAGAAFDVTIEHVGFWDLRFAIADSYRADHAFVAGDSAHSHPPYGGYGINTGFEDAVNLGWKLAAQIEGWAGPHLLDSYDAERRPVFASTARDFIARSIEVDRAFLAAFDPSQDRADFERHWQDRAAGAKGEVNAFEPNYEGSPVIDAPGTPGAVGGHKVEARAGHHLTPCRLSSGRDLFEVLGHGFTLLALGADPDTVARFVAAAAALQIPLAVVDDAAAATRDAYRARLVLVRPDQFVAWASDDAPDPDIVLRRAVGYDVSVTR